jgi:hypothetical protein
LVEFIIDLIGTTLAAFLGVAFIIVGIMLTLTIFGAVIGLPLAFLGYRLILRANRDE